MVNAQLNGFVTDVPMFGTLGGAMTASANTVVITVPTQSYPVGLLEVEGELIHVTAWNAGTSTATIPPWGRGQQGTTPAAHPAGAKVIVNPRYPRRRIGQIINQVVQAICPPLFAVQTGQFDTVFDTYDYPLPTTTRTILRVEWRPRGVAYEDWRPLRSATIRRVAGAPMLHLNSCPQFAEVRYTVGCNAVPLTTETQLFTDSGLANSAIDVVTLGSIPRLVSTNELSRQQLSSVEVSERATLVPATSGTNAAKFYMQMFQDRLEAEVSRQRQEYPLTVQRNV